MGDKTPPPPPTKMTKAMVLILEATRTGAHLQLSGDSRSGNIHGHNLSGDDGRVKADRGGGRSRGNPNVNHSRGKGAHSHGNSRGKQTKNASSIGRGFPRKHSTKGT